MFLHHLIQDYYIYRIPIQTVVRWQQDMQITLLEAFNGVEKTIKYAHTVQCDKCGGSGAAAGSKNVTCKTCGGTGI